jgi:hypothetical protein
VALLGVDEQRRLVASFADRHPDEWAAVGSDAGDVPVLERSLVTGAVRVVILERRLPLTLRLDHLERGAPVRSPEDALAVTLRAEAVWSAIDEQAAEKAAALAETERDWLEAIITVAVARKHEAHARRVRRLAATLRRRFARRWLSCRFGCARRRVRPRRGRPRLHRVGRLALLPVCVAQALLTSLRRTDVT